jgi:hypothetical protein
MPALLRNDTTRKIGTSRVPSKGCVEAACAAVEKYGRDPVGRVLQLYDPFQLQPADIAPAAEADQKHGFEAVKVALEFGFRGADILVGAAAVGLWPDPPTARASLEKARSVPRIEPPPPPKPPEPEKVEEAAAQAEPAAAGVEVNPEAAKTLAVLGFPAFDHAEGARALKDYPKGLQTIAPFAAGVVHGATIYQAAYAAEKHSKESVELVVTKLVPIYMLEGPDIVHAAASVKLQGFEATEVAIDLGWRKSDILHAAQSVKLWPFVKEGRENLEKMRKLFQKVRVDIMDEDIRHCATTLRNLNEEVLERALRERHKKNEREAWIQGLGIQLVAWCYKLSAPHTGAAIDECRERNARRDRFGHEVLACLSRKFGRAVNMPPWLGGAK